MEPYARKRCADPHAFYSSPEEVLADSGLTADEKEYILKSMAADAELLSVQEEGEAGSGEHSKDLTAIHKALSQLGERHSFDAQNVASTDDSVPERKAFARIVAAVGGNDNLDREVVRVTENVARLSGGEVIFVSVVPPISSLGNYGAASPMGGLAVAPPELQDNLNARVEERRAILRDFFDNWGTTAIPYHLEVCHGQVDVEVLRVAKDHAADLIVVGSHDRSWIEGLFSPETSREVARSATCPVLIVPEEGEN